MSSEGTSQYARKHAVPADMRNDTGSGKVLLSLPAELKGRMLAVIEHTRAQTGVRSQQAFIRGAIERECSEVERLMNRGERFPDPAPDVGK